KHHGSIILDRQLRRGSVSLANLDKLLFSQVSKYKGKKYHCRRCLRHFVSEDLLEKHSFYCNNNEALRVEFPDEKYIEFKNYNRKLKVPFAIYADFESILSKVDSCKPNHENSYTNEYQKHIPCGFSYYKTYAYGNKESKPIVYREFKEYDIIVKDHNHLTGKEGNLKVIPITNQNYISFPFKIKLDEYEVKNGNKNFIKPIMYEMRFLDSLAFMSSSVDILAKNLKYFPHLENHFPKDKIEIITRKLPYCYDYIDSFEKFKEETIPPKESFYKTF
ncbi:hypothetical protein L9F63_002803, partial [Diploptera punctata]